MNWKFWKKKNEDVVLTPSYTPPPPRQKTVDDIIKETVFDEEILNKIDLFSIAGTRLVCIKNCGESKSNFKNFRDFVKSKTETVSTFFKDEVYEVSYVTDEYIGFKSGRNASFIKGHPYGYPYVFDFFILESEYLSLKRDEQINSILE